MKIAEYNRPTQINRLGEQEKELPEQVRRSDPGLALSSAFWAQFVERNWGRHPLVIKQPFANLFATSGEIFKVLVNSSDQFRTGDESFALGFYFEHASLQAEIRKFLPEASDQSVAGYAQRITAQLQGRHFGLIVEEVQARDATLWQRMREFLRPLYEFTGIPGDNVKATIFLGNYDRTPFGLHQGESENFQFVIEGRKRLRVWPPEFFRDTEDVSHTLDYERLLDGSIALDGEPGDVIYWPSGYWHIGEAVDEDITVALSIALFMEYQPGADIIKHAGGRIERCLETANPATAPRVFPNELRAGAEQLINPVLKTASDTLRNLARDAEFPNELKLTLLNRMTGFGFNNVPPALTSKELEDLDVVHCDPDFPVAWMAWEADEIVCSANGHSFSVLAHPKVIALLERLNCGTVSSVKDLVEDHAGVVEVDGTELEASREAIRALLEKLYSLRVLHLVKVQDC